MHSKLDIPNGREVQSHMADHRLMKGQALIIKNNSLCHYLWAGDSKIVQQDSLLQKSDLFLI